MVLVCLSVERGQYRIDDDSGKIRLEFYSGTNPALVAQRIADATRKPWVLQVCDKHGQAPQLIAFTPHAHL